MVLEMEKSSLKNLLEDGYKINFTNINFTKPPFSLAAIDDALKIIWISGSGYSYEGLNLTPDEIVAQVIL